MARRKVDPHVVWAGVVVKLSDGTTHAVEFTDDRTTADIKFNPQAPGYTSAWIQGRGRYWAEAPQAPEKRRELESRRGVDS